MDTKTYWNNFQKEHPEITTNKYDAFSLGSEGDIESNNKLAYLIRDGVKTATASARELYDVDGDPIPKVGEYSIVLDGYEQPVCIIKEVVVETVPLMQVSAEHAYHEGEDSRGLDEWRRDHIAFFKREYEEEKLPFNENIPILCEVFEVVYK